MGPTITLCYRPREAHTISTIMIYSHELISYFGLLSGSWVIWLEPDVFNSRPLCLDGAQSIMGCIWRVMTWLQLISITIIDMIMSLSEMFLKMFWHSKFSSCDVCISYGVSCCHIFGISCQKLLIILMWHYHWLLVLVLIPSNNGFPNSRAAKP